MASRATNGVKIPDCKVTRAEIIAMFQKQMKHLRERLNVGFMLLFKLYIHCDHYFQSDAVKGEVSNACDAWQASNIDRYFAISGHWIEELSPGIWELESALFSFTVLNNSHNGQCLGQVLFKIVDRLDISHKVGFNSVESPHVLISCLDWTYYL
jgi:hypothetical protein